MMSSCALVLINRAIVCPPPPQKKKQKQNTVHLDGSVTKVVALSVYKQLTHFLLSSPPSPFPPSLPFLHFSSLFLPLSLLSPLPPFRPPRTLLWTLTFTGCIWQLTIWCGTSQQEWPSSHAENPSYSASAPTSRMLSPLPLGYVPSPFPNQLVVVWEGG